MRIFIAGSMHFAPQMLDVQKRLQDMGHEAVVPTDTHDCVENPNLNMDLAYCIETEIDKQQWNLIATCDALLVLNYPKGGVEGYVGGATLTDMTIARHFGKKIFLLYPSPDERRVRYAHEIMAMRPVVLGGDFSLIQDAMRV